MPRIVTLTPNPALDVSVEADAVVPNRKLRCDHPRTDPGGGGINVSRAAKRLGAETVAIFPVGGVFGDALASLVAAEGVPSKAIPVSGATRIAFVARDQSANSEYRFGLPGAELREAELITLLAALEDETNSGDYVVGSGSLPPNAPSDFWARAARIAKKKGARFVLDSTSGVREALKEGVFLLRLNKTDAPFVAGRELDWPEGAANFAQDLAKQGRAERVVMSHGGGGAILVSRDAVHRCPSFKVLIASAVGAGDSMVASLIVSMIRGDDDRSALRWGMAAAGATLMTPGTALFDPAEATKLFRSAN